LYIFQLFFVFSILGTIYYGYFFSFHLLHITQNNQLLKRVIMAVTRNGELYNLLSYYLPAPSVNYLSVCLIITLKQ